MPTLVSKSHRLIQLFQHLLLILWALNTFKTLRHAYRFHGLVGSLRFFVKRASKFFLTSARSLPLVPVNQLIQHQINETLATLSKQFATHDMNQYTILPNQGLDFGALTAELNLYANLNLDYQSGQVSGTVYHGGQNLDKCINLACSMFLHSNPLHPDVFPGLRKMEAEIIQMALNLYHGGPDACGNLTSGGTESILLACKTYRDLALKERGVTRPEMIIPDSAHAAFDKACHYFNIRPVKIPVGPDFRVNLELVKYSINENTIMLIGSSPNFPHGIIDDIAQLSELAIKSQLPLHVDCCLGSFLMAFMEDAGFNVPMFDFRLPGVTSMSVDTHKYGFAPKGSSVIMYRTPDYRKHQYFVATDWLGGVYASPTMAGSRPGSLIAGCWAAMMHMGKRGYIDATREVVRTAREISSRIRTEFGRDIEVVGDPIVSVVAIRSSIVNIYSVNDLMSKSGWNLNALLSPAAIHIACTYLTVGKTEQFISDLQRAVTQVKANPELYKDGSAAIYGMAASIPDRSIVGDISVGYLDLMTRV